MIKETEWKGGRAVTLESDGVRLTAPLEFGPRIMFFGLAGEDNLLNVIENEKGTGPDGNYFFHGGHRLWHAPEHSVRTYQPDNDPLECHSRENSFLLRAPVEEKTGVQKEIEITACGARTFHLSHRMRNEGLWAVAFAPWALTVFRPGGRAVIPLLPKGEHPRDLLPAFSLVQWPYTDMGLGCWSTSFSCIRVEVAKVPGPQKIGLSDWPGWLGYWINGKAFIKFTPPDPEASSYPDLGCKMEVFSDGNMLELETLGALGDVGPGETVTHDEYWTVLEDLPEPTGEKEVAQHWLPAVNDWLKSIPRKAG